MKCQPASVFALAAAAAALLGTAVAPAVGQFETRSAYTMSVSEVSDEDLVTAPFGDPVDFADIDIDFLGSPSIGNNGVTYLDFIDIRGASSQQDYGVVTAKVDYRVPEFQGFHAGIDFSYPPTFPISHRQIDPVGGLSAGEGNNDTAYISGPNAMPVGMAALPAGVSAIGSPVPLGTPDDAWVLYPARDEAANSYHLRQFWKVGGSFNDQGSLFDFNLPSDTTAANFDLHHGGIVANGTVNAVYGSFFRDFSVGGVPTFEHGVARVDVNGFDVIAKAPVGRFVRSNVSFYDLEENDFGATAGVTWIESPSSGGEATYRVNLQRESLDDPTQLALTVDFGEGQVAESFIKSWDGDDAFFQSAQLAYPGAEIHEQDLLVAGLINIQRPQLPDNEMLFVIALLDLGPSDAEGPGAAMASEPSIVLLDQFAVVGVGDEIFGQTVDQIDLGSTPLNENGELVVGLRTDGSSGFNTVAGFQIVPEPTAGLIVGLGGLVLLRRCRQGAV